MIDIIIGNLIFWPIYLWICNIPYKVMQAAIDSEW